MYLRSNNFRTDRRNGAKPSRRCSPPPGRGSLLTFGPVRVRVGRERGPKVHYIAVHRVSDCPFSRNLAKMAFAEFMESGKMQIGEYGLLEGYKKTGPGSHPGPLEPTSISK